MRGTVVRFDGGLGCLTIMREMRIEIKKNLFGGHTVGYDCPHCGEGLNSPLNDAGASDVCPNCRMPFVVPGISEAERIRAEQDALAKQAAAAAEKQRQTKLLEEQNRQRDLAARAEAEWQRERANAQLVPYSQPFRQQSASVQQTQTRRCPFCAEEILVAAQKCKHCGEFLDGRGRTAAPAPVYMQAPQGQGGCSLIIVIALGIVLGIMMLALL